MKLSSILSTIYPNITSSFEDVTFEHLCHDTRKVKPNCLFLLIEGENFDPHNKVTEIEEYVSFFISEKPILTDVPYIIDPDLKSKAGLIYSSFFGHPEQTMEHIGITGTNGKTSIASILQFILQDIYPTSYIGTLGTKINGIDFKSDFDTPTTPQSYDLIPILKDFTENNIFTNIMEVSSHALHQGRVNIIPFSYGVFSNLTIDHLDFHKTFTNYLESKKLLFDQLPDTGFAVINADDTYNELITADTKAKIITFGIENDADIRATDISLSENGTTFTVNYLNEKEIFTTKLIGHFNVSNILAAIGVALLKGIDLSYIKERVSTFIGIPGRLQKVETPTRHIFVDYAHTPDGLESVLTALSSLKGNGKLLTVFGCGGDRDTSKRPLMGAIAEKYSDFSFITSDNPRTEDPEKIIDDIASGFSGFSFNKIADRKEAIKQAIIQSNPEDLIIVAGKGHENYQIIGHEKYHFDDIEISQELSLFSL
jgi:UDP-N-acetylmuramoyl-L-alanyl-D-glutamate--2,6-diaminopimelate ligase